MDGDASGAKVPTGSGSSDGAPSWIRYVAMLTGVLAGVAGYLTVRGANLSNEAIYHSNQGVLLQAQASDQWAEYQADSIKKRIVETQLATGTVAADARSGLEKDVKELAGRQPELKAKAIDLERQRNLELGSGMKRLEEKDALDYAGVAIQLGIALASVAALTRRREAFAAGLLAGGIGVGITAYILLRHYLIKA